MDTINVLFLKQLTKMKEINLKKTTMYVILTASLFAGAKAYQIDSKVCGDLLLENVEALSSNEEGTYSGYGKYYEIGQGYFLTWVAPSVVLPEKWFIGMNISGDLARLLQDNSDYQITFGQGYSMACQPNMGCYSSCEEKKYQYGNETSGVRRGCD